MICFVEIFIEKNAYSVEVGKLIKSFTGEPFGTINKKIEQGKPVCIKNFDNTKFYSSIRKFVDFLNNLESMHIDYYLKNNGDPMNRQFLDEIVNNLDNISLEDFR